MSAEHHPVIILGMHRSGTSLISRALDAFGLFLGAKKEANHEALYFLRLNEWLLEQAGATWDRPGPAARLVEDAEVRGVATDALRGFLESPRLISYLGYGKYLRNRRLGRLEFPWGFKDPRATVTLPLWLDIFPNARVVHVHRHGVDVAQSLVVRMRTQLDDTKDRLAREGHLADRVGRARGRIADSVRFRSLDEAFGLWEEYADFADTHLADVPAERLMHLSYEDFVTDPDTGLASLASFAGLVPEASDVAGIRDRVDGTRANAWRRSEDLRAFAETVSDSPAMKRLGY
jgi:hypothetical protein